MIEVNFSSGDLAEARRFAQHMASLKGGLDSRIVGTRNNDIIGILGEWAVKRYFDTIRVEYVEPEREHADYKRNQGDVWDLKIQNKTIDVKSSRKYKGIVLNHNQFWKTKYKKIDMLIGVYFPNDTLRSAIIIGYGFPRDLVRDPDKDFVKKHENNNPKSGEMYSIPEEKINIFKRNNLTI